MTKAPVPPYLTVHLRRGSAMAATVSNPSEVVRNA